MSVRLLVFLACVAQAKMLGAKNKTLQAEGLRDTVPKVIWMLWDSGRENAPAMQRICIDSWERQNPGWNLRVLNLTEAEALINRPKYFTDETWRSIKIQAKSDIIRVNLLAEHGGVWADATTYTTKPLEKWIDVNAPFFIIQRDDQNPDFLENAAIRPFVCSWFIAAHRSSTIVQKWRAKTNEFWKNWNHEEYEYYWVHHIFAKLVQNDPEFQQLHSHLRFMSGSSPMCYNEEESPIYKVKTPNCKTRILAPLMQSPEYRE